MPDPFMSELKLIAFDFAPKAWAECNGQLMQINQNQALFALLGTTYGGNGQTTFGLPNLQGRVPMHVGNGHGLGERGGEAAHTLTTSEMPQHPHAAIATSTVAPDPPISPDSTTRLGATQPGPLYAPPSNLTQMNTGSVAPNGGSQPHENQQPYLVLKWIIALQGIFPSQN